MVTVSNNKSNDLICKIAYLKIMSSVKMDSKKLVLKRD